MTGLNYVKLDLHVHTPASACYIDKNHTAEQIVNSSIEKGLQGIAITDHNTADWIEKIQNAVEGKDLIIFPGVEISLEIGFHLVALFDPSVSQKNIEGLLGALKITPEQRGKSDSYCKLSPHDVINIIHEQNGLVILPHIDLQKGAFYVQSLKHTNGKINIPVTCSGFFNEASYDAVECSEGKLPDGFDETHHINRIPAYYQASDNPDDKQPTRHSYIGIGKKYSLFKLDQFDIEGLRQCFSDPDVRIRLMGSYELKSHPNIKYLKIEGDGFLRGLTINFHKGLNSIIGGKGVGKSLAVEFIRFGLIQPPRDEDLLKDHIGKLEKRLGNGNSVEIIYEQDDGSRYKIRRTLLDVNRDGTLTTEEICTNIDSGENLKVDFNTMFPILAYSQTEVISIANNKDAQLQLIDRFIDPKPHEQIIMNIQDKLIQNDGRFDKAIRANFRLGSVKKEIDTLTVKIKSINKSLANTLFNEIKIAELKRTLIQSRIDIVTKLSEQIEECIKDINTEDIDELPEEFSKDPPIIQIQEITNKTKNQLLKGLRTNLKALSENLKKIDSINQKLQPYYKELEKKYSKLLKNIGGDREEKEQERQRLEKQKLEFDAEAKDLRLLVKDLNSILDERNQLLDQLEGAHKKYYETRKSKYAQLTELSNRKLRLEIEHASDRSIYENILMELLKGSNNLISTSDRRKIAQNILPRRFINLVLDRNVSHLSKEGEISENCAQRVIEKLWSSEDFTEILAVQHNCYPGDIPSIRFKKSEGIYDELNEISIGQKCTALLIIALCDGTMPIIIDQPEDALDIASVWEDVTQKLRKGKDTRQFILTTHNPCVAVGGDSDQFIILEASANLGEIKHEGAIDRLDVRQSVIDHMEGGPGPYRLRAQKYNIKK